MANWSNNRLENGFFNCLFYGVFIITFAVIIGSIILVILFGRVGCQMIGNVQNDGLKSVISQVWNGTNNPTSFPK